MLVTSDGGKNWTSHETPVIDGTQTTGIASLAFRDRLHGIAAGGDIAAPDSSRDNMAFTADGGVSWFSSNPPTFAGPIYGAFYVAGGPLLVAVGPRGASLSRTMGKAGYRSIRRVTGVPGLPARGRGGWSDRRRIRGWSLRGSDEVRRTED